MEKSQPLYGFVIKDMNNHIKRYTDHVISELDCGDSSQQPTGVQCYIIGYIYDNDGKDVFQRDIEHACNIRRSTATGILQLMEKKGFITREPVDYDARLKKIVLTDSTKAQHINIMSIIYATNQRLIDGIPQTDLDTFFRVLTTMKKNLDQ